MSGIEMTFRPWPGFVIVLVLVAGMLAMALLEPVSLLQVVTADGERVLCTRVGDTTSITLRFTHSMFGGFVEERYLLRSDGILVRQGIVTENAAAAEYYASDGDVRRIADGFEVLAGPFMTEGLTVRIDSRGKHRLTVGTKSISLYEHLGESVQVRLEGERIPHYRVPRMCSDSR
jgi:hypothetical protein